jgi:hypothetical protein
VLLSLMCMHACEARELLLYSNAMDPLLHQVTPPATRAEGDQPQAQDQGTILQALVDVLREVAVGEGRHCSVCGCVRQHDQTWSQACRCSTCNMGCTMRVRASTVCLCVCVFAAGWLGRWVCLCLVTDQSPSGISRAQLTEPAMPGFPLQALQALLRDRQEVR